MKSATIPPLRVTPDLRADVESVLEKGETLSGFVEDALRRQIDYRRTQKEFIARGLAARDDARKKNAYVSAEKSLAALDRIIEKRRPKP
jgi:hypothetical protein